MTKQEFILKLKVRLVRLPKVELEERLSFYSEMIDDGIEEGLTEEEAVAKIGSVDEIASQIISEIPLSKIVKENIKPKKKLGALEITLIVLGSPIWLTLLISAVAVVISLYASLLAVVISLWAVFVAFTISSFASVIVGIAQSFLGNKILLPIGIGVGLTLAGLSIFTFHACVLVSKGSVSLVKIIVKCIKNCFIKEEEYA